MKEKAVLLGSVFGILTAISWLDRATCGTSIGASLVSAAVTTAFVALTFGLGFCLNRLFERKEE